MGLCAVLFCDTWDNKTKEKKIAQILDIENFGSGGGVMLKAG